MDIKKSIEYNDVGQKLTIEIQLKYKDLETFELPECCVECPVGFSCNIECGRNVPFVNEDYKTRPNTCKLKEIKCLNLKN